MSTDLERAAEAETGNSTRVGWLLALVSLVLLTVLVGLGFFRLLDSPDSPAPKASTPPIASADRQDPDATPSAVATPEVEGVLGVVPRNVSFVNAQNGRPQPLPASLRRVYAPDHFRVSPDETKLVFISDGKLYLAQSDGSHLRPIARVGYESSASWAPDGRGLVFNNGGRIIRLELPDQKKTLVASGRQTAYNPGFSPDGQQILFTRTPKEGRAFALWTVPSTGGPEVLLAERAAFGTFSPDGTEIAARRTDYGEGRPITHMTCQGISILDRDGHPTRTLGSLNWHSQINPDALWPAWSPNGNKIAYEQTYKGEVVVANLRTNRVTKLGEGTSPTWVDDHTLIVEDYVTFEDYARGHE